MRSRARAIFKKRRKPVDRFAENVLTVVPETSVNDIMPNGDYGTVSANGENRLSFAESQMASADGDVFGDADGFQSADDMDADGDYENARGGLFKKLGAKIKAKVKKVKANVKKRKAKRVAKRKVRKAKRVARRKKSGSILGNIMTGGMLGAAKKIKAKRQAMKAAQQGEAAEAEPVETESGETVEPMVTKTDEVATPEVISPVGTGEEVIEPEITEGGEVMVPEVTTVSEEPTEVSEDAQPEPADEGEAAPEEGSEGTADEGDMSADGIHFRTAYSADGEAFYPEVISRKMNADGNPEIQVLHYRKIPAVRNSEGEVIMPYRMADGSVVTTKELYHSACGKVSKSADGVVRIEKAVRTFPDFKQFSGENDNSGVFSAEGGMFTLAGAKANWKKWLAIGAAASLIGGGIWYAKKKKMF